MLVQDVYGRLLERPHTSLSKPPIAYAAEHLADRYRLELTVEGSRFVFADGSLTAALDVEDARLATIAQYLAEPLPMFVQGAVLECDLDVLEAELLASLGLRVHNRWSGDGFRVWLTHDIDQLRMQHQLVSLVGRLLWSGDVRAAIEAVGEWAGARRAGTDVWWNLERIVELEQSLGVRSTFFMLDQRPIAPWWSVPGYPFRFGTYRVGDPEVAALIRAIHASGAEIGLHGSFGTSVDGVRFAEEREQLKSIVGSQVMTNRQHWLDYAFWGTAAVHEHAGIRVDSSIGFNPPGRGYRARTAFPYRPLHAVRGSCSTIVEVTPVLMEGALSSRSWRAEIDELLHSVQARRGVVSVIWHNNVFVRNSAMAEAYRYLIERSRDLGGSFVVGEDIIALATG